MLHNYRRSSVKKKRFLFICFTFRMCSSLLHVGFASFLMYANRTEIQGIALDPEQSDQVALAPISGIALTTAVDYYAGKSSTIISICDQFLFIVAMIKLF